jgi:hypothetical protein
MLVGGDLAPAATSLTPESWARASIRACPVANRDVNARARVEGPPSVCLGHATTIRAGTSDSAVAAVPEAWQAGDRRARDLRLRA